EYRRQAGSRKPLIVVQIVKQRQNAHEVKEWLEKWKGSPGVDRIKVKSYVTWDGRSEKNNGLRFAPAPGPSAIAGDKPWMSVTILWDGRVVPCCFDYDGILTLGNVREQSLREIWRGEKMHQLRSCHRAGDLEGIALCAQCKDKEGYSARKWYYPL